MLGGEISIARLAQNIALAALAVGVIEAFASFFASNYKEVVVFTLIIPVLLYLSLAHGHADSYHLWIGERDSSES